MNTIETERLVLRRFAPQDAAGLFAYLQAPIASCFLSLTLCERLGMRQEGAFKEFVSFKNDEAGAPIYENTLQYALLRHEWQRQQAG